VLCSTRKRARRRGRAQLAERRGRESARDGEAGHSWHNLRPRGEASGPAARQGPNGAAEADDDGAAEAGERREHRCRRKVRGYLDGWVDPPRPVSSSSCASAMESAPMLASSRSCEYWKRECGNLRASRKMECGPVRPR
jgi:hypothetical protein